MFGTNVFCDRGGRERPITAAEGYRGVLCLAVLALMTASSALAQGTAEDYRRWRTYNDRTSNLVYRDSVRPNWVGKRADHFWYRVKTGRDTFQYVLVDATAGTKKSFNDRDALNDRLQRIDGESDSEQVAVAPAGLPGETRVRRSGGGGSQRVTIRFENQLDQPLLLDWVMADGSLRRYGTVAASSSTTQSTFQGHAWLLRSADETAVAAFVAGPQDDVAVIDAATPRPRRWRTTGARGGGAASRPRSTASPDRRWQVTFDQGNVVVIDQQSDQRTVVTDDASDDNSYGGRVWWSPDSQHFVVMKTRPGGRREIHMIDSAPDNSIHAELLTISYAKPGDRLDHPRPVLFHVDQLEPHLIDDTLFPNPFGLTDLDWNQDSQSFSLVYNQRGHQLLRLIRVDVASHQPAVVIDETSDTFVCYSGKKYLARLDDSDEVVWMSERSGWNHLYLFDATSGELTNPITSGRWVVRDVERLDRDTRQAWLVVSGIDADQDPYHRHLIRVGLDGQNLTRLTTGDGDHQWEFSPDGRYLIDQFSRVDLPPIHVLRDAETGNQICQLEQADASDLLATGWRPPERFVAKGRDGQTDIHGIIVRPTSFQADQRYPVLESIYAGPHAAFVPKQFGRHSSLYGMAELGFIVVKIDGMGTSYRSKAFHDVCWQNLGDAGFPDRIAWIKAAAATRPEMHLQRVGIWGGSAGGQSAMRALIAHGDFYHAAVADCGCHDNRVDKIWWNEQWMGWPIGDHYHEQSNVTCAAQLQGDLLLIWGELDRNVDPASTMQVIDALVRANKDFEQLIMPGVGHGAAGHPYARRRQADFFVRKLWHREPRQPTSDSKTQ